MDAQEVEGNFSVCRVLTNTQACDVFGGEPAGTPLFYIMEMVYMQKMLDFIT